MIDGLSVADRAALVTAMFRAIITNGDLVRSFIVYTKLKAAAASNPDQEVRDRATAILATLEKDAAIAAYNGLKQAVAGVAGGGVQP
jgi:hypothetical protein